jgi:signal transduction histidine kinase
MRPEDIPKALDRFGQVDGNLNRRYEGLGIGLSIVQALVRQHGGALTVASGLGIGTKVTVRFPTERCLAPLAASEQAAATAPSAAVRTGSRP